MYIYTYVCIHIHIHKHKFTESSPLPNASILKQKKISSFKILALRFISSHEKICFPQTQTHGAQTMLPFRALHRTTGLTLLILSLSADRFAYLVNFSNWQALWFPIPTQSHLTMVCVFNQRILHHLGKEWDHGVLSGEQLSSVWSQIQQHQAPPSPTESGAWMCLLMTIWSILVLNKVRLRQTEHVPFPFKDILTWTWSTWTLQGVLGGFKRLVT